MLDAERVVSDAVNSSTCFRDYDETRGISFREAIKDSKDAPKKPNRDATSIVLLGSVL